MEILKYVKRGLRPEYPSFAIDQTNWQGALDEPFFSTKGRASFQCKLLEEGALNPQFVSLCFKLMPSPLKDDGARVSFKIPGICVAEAGYYAPLIVDEESSVEAGYACNEGYQLQATGTAFLYENGTKSLFDPRVASIFENVLKTKPLCFEFQGSFLRRGAYQHLEEDVFGEGWKKTDFYGKVHWDVTILYPYGVYVNDSRVEQAYARLGLTADNAIYIKIYLDSYLKALGITPGKKTKVRGQKWVFSGLPEDPCPNYHKQIYDGMLQFLIAEPEGNETLYFSKSIVSEFKDGICEILFEKKETE